MPDSARDGLAAPSPPIAASATPVDPPPPLTTPSSASAATSASSLASDDTVTPGMRIAAAWSWRVLVTVAAVAIVGYLLAYLSEITIPGIIALLLNALLSPVRRVLVDKGWKPGLAAAVVFVGGLLIVAGVVTLVIRQFVVGAPDLVDRVRGGVEQIRDWLVNGPFKVSQDQIDGLLNSAREALANNRQALTSGALNTASSVGHVVTGAVLALFILFFLLRDGRQVWTWIVGLAPQRGRAKIFGAADRAWTTLGGYVRATVLVAFVDAVGIGLGLLVLGVPLAIPLTALVFLSSFVPIIGALISGIAAVLVALVTVGWVKALIVLGVVIAVQQLESHVLQPILLGRAVSLHPLAVALSIASGVIVGGIVGALLAVPIAACLNAAVKFLAGKEKTTDDTKDKVEQRLEAREGGGSTPMQRAKR